MTEQFVELTTGFILQTSKKSEREYRLQGPETEPR